MDSDGRSGLRPARQAEYYIEIVFDQQRRPARARCGFVIAGRQTPTINWRDVRDLTLVRLGVLSADQFAALPPARD